MKRIFSLALICVVLVFSLAFPSYANEVETEDVFFNVLDYAYPNDGNVFNIYGSGTASCYFHLPTNRVVKYVDMIVTLNPGATGLSVQIGGSATKINLYAEWITGTTYRVYGNVGYGSNYIYTYFTATGLTYVVFEKFECTYQFLTQYDTDGYCDILAPTSNYVQTIHYIPGDTVNGRTFPVQSSVDNNAFTLNIYSNNWKKYDYLDVRMIIRCASITSIDAFLDNAMLDLQVSELTTNQWDANEFFVSMRVDLTSVSKVTSDIPRIIISALLPYDGTCTVTVSYMSGFVVSDSGNPLFSYLRDLTNNLRTWFTDLKNALNGSTASGDQFKDDSAGLISGLGDITASMDSVDRPSFDTIDLDFSSDISGASSLMGNIFTTFTSVDWLSRLFLVSITLVLVSYILYGKD